MILHLLRLRRNVNRNVFNDRKNVSATAHWSSEIVSKSVLAVERIMSTASILHMWYIKGVSPKM